MAAEYVLMRLDLEDDPAVTGMAELLEVDCLVIVGRLWKLWSIVSQQTDTGWLPHFSLKSLDAKLRLPGFASACETVGWLQQRSGGIAVPNFENWLSHSAKKRAKAAIKKRKQRANAPDVPPVGGQNGDTKGDKKGTPLIIPLPIPPSTSEVESGGLGGKIADGDTVLECAPLECHEEAFAAFYAAFPRKSNRHAAARQWRSLNPSRELAAEIIAAAKRQSGWPDRQGLFMPLPERWLADRRWEDEEPPKPSANGHAKETTEQMRARIRDENRKAEEDIERRKAEYRARR